MRFEFLGAISKVCHASGGKIRFELSGPGGKILGLSKLGGTAVRLATDMPTFNEEVFYAI